MGLIFHQSKQKGTPKTRTRLGQEADSGAPFHCAIAPEVSKRFSHGRGISAASTPTSVSWNAANQALVSPGLKIGFADNS